ncbi:MAG: kelch repeat-containing protein [Bacteroidota bacterium]
MLTFRLFIAYLLTCFIFTTCNEVESIREIEVFTGSTVQLEDTIRLSGYYEDLLIDLDHSGNINIQSLEITEHGHCWSQNASPKIVDDCTSLGILTEQDTFYSEISSLEADRTYFSRAYIMSNDIIYYGNTIRFKTPNVEEPEPEPEPIILWTKKRDFPDELNKSFSAFSIDNDFFIGLGIKNDGSQNLRFWRYNTNNDTWRETKEFNGTPVIHPVSITLNNKAYIIGGSRINADFMPSKQLRVYDPIKDEWKNLAVFRGKVRNHATGFGHNNKLYYGLGKDKSDFWVYDLNRRRWSALRTELPEDLQKREFAQAFVVDDKAYIGFGKVEAYKNDLWQFDISNNEWKRLANCPGEGRIISCLFIISNQAYFVGGNNGEDLTDHWKYDIQQDRWQKIKDDFDLINKVSSGRTVSGKGYALFLADQSFWEFNPPTE